MRHRISPVIGLSLFYMLLAVCTGGLKAMTFRTSCFDPFTVYCREDVQVTLEVTTAGTEVTDVTITRPSEMMMYADGTDEHGRSVPGGVYICRIRSREM